VSNTIGDKVGNDVWRGFGEVCVTEKWKPVFIIDTGDISAVRKANEMDVSVINVFDGDRAGRQAEMLSGLILSV